MICPSRKHVLPIIFLTSIVVVTLLFESVAGKDALSNRDRRITSPMFYKAIAEAVKKADEYYYQEIDRKKMYEGAIKGALAALGRSLHLLFAREGAKAGKGKSLP